MNNSVDILNELKEVSPLLAGINKVNVFTVPQGYFETVAGTVTACLNENVTAVAWEQGEVPAGYFENLPAGILAKIKDTVAGELQEISPLLAGIKKANPFEAPQQYFEQLPPVILSKVEADEMPVLLQQAKSLQPFEVPQEYFKNLGGIILNKVNQQAGAKVVTMPNRRNLLVKYAAAAMLTGAVALGVYKFTNNISPVTIITPETASIKMEPGIEKGINMDDKKFVETLNNLKEEDIVQYLEKNGSDADIALLTSSVDENNLPNQQDYFLDDKTLDKFLETISSEN